MSQPDHALEEGKTVKPLRQEIELGGNEFVLHCELQIY